MSPELGMTVRFVPYIRFGDKCRNGDPFTPELPKVTGKITYINHAHRFYLVETAAGYRECFKF